MRTSSSLRFIKWFTDIFIGNILMAAPFEVERARVEHPAVTPREIAFIDSLPKARNGKIIRRLLKARELGLPECDLSTLENN